MILWLTNLRQVVILRKRSVLANELQCAHKVIVALDHLLYLLLTLSSTCRRVLLSLRLFWFAHGQAADKLELISNEVGIVSLR